MESPPQFAPPAPAPKRSNALLIIVLVLLGVCALCCIGFFVIGYGFFNKVKGFASCTTHYVFVRQAMSDYAKDHGNKLPDAKTWQDDIAPYYGREKSGNKVNGGGFFDFGDPNKDLGCAAEDGSPATGMAFNSELAGKTVDEAKKMPGQILIFEVSDTGRNLSRPYKAQTGDSPGKIMGKPRPWLALPVEGNLNVSDQSGTSFSSGPGNGL